MNLKEFVGKFPKSAKPRLRKQLAIELMVTAEAIRSWERGTRKPRLEYVLELSRITEGQITVEDLRPDLYKKARKGGLTFSKAKIKKTGSTKKHPKKTT